jgi:hypothetical protein
MGAPGAAYPSKGINKAKRLTIVARRAERSIVIFPHQKEIDHCGAIASLVLSSIHTQIGRPW